MSLVFLSVIVCTKNRGNELKGCLPLIIEQANEFSDVEILVVDNGSIDKTRDIVEGIPAANDFGIHYIYEPVDGLCQARNRGREEASGKVLAYIDDDVRINDQWVRNVRQHFLENRSDCLGGRVTVRLGGEVPIKGGQQMLWFFGENDLGSDLREYTVTDPIPYPPGCNMAFRDYVFDALGGFDTCLKYYFDETDFFRRARLHNFKILYAPDVAVEQLVPVERLTKQELQRKTYLLGKGAAMFGDLSDPGLLKWAKRLGTCGVKSVYHLLGYAADPSFGKFFAFWFNYSSTVQHIKYRFGGK